MLIWTILIAYILVMVGIGVYCRKYAGGVSDYVLGGRNVGAWMTAFAYGTSYFSAVIFIGYAGQFGWNYGLSSTWIGLSNAIIGSALAWMVLGNRTRLMTKSLHVATMPEFFEKRYASKRLKTAAALIVFVFLIPYTASVYNGLSTLFADAFPGIPYSAWIFIMAALTAVYVILGGYKATTVNDFIQGIIMLGGIAAVVLLALKQAGGLSTALSELSLIPVSSESGNLGSLFGPDPLNLLGVVILTSLGTWGMPQMVQKFYAVKDKPSIKRGTIISTLFAVIVAGGSYFLGGLGRLYCTTDSSVSGLTFIQTLANGKPDYDSIVPAILHASVPEILFGIVVVLVLSASMSTLASLVLSSSSTLTIDLIKPFTKGEMSEKKQVRTMRIFIGVFLIVSVLIAINKQTLDNMGVNISALMSISWGALAGAFLAPFVYGLFSKRVSRPSVWVSFASGLGITVISMILFNLGLFPELTAWAAGVKIGGMPLNLASPINWGAIAMLVGLIEMPLVNLCAKSPEIPVGDIFSCFEQK